MPFTYNITGISKEALFSGLSAAMAKDIDPLNAYNISQGIVNFIVDPSASQQIELSVNIETSDASGKILCISSSYSIAYTDI